MEPNHNYFDILGLNEQFTQDLSTLDSSLAEMQAQVHPDNCVNATAQEKRLMMQYSAMLNEAYTVIRDPLKRACHLLELNGVEMGEEANASIPQEFLMLQLELREKLEDHQNNRQALKEFKYKIEKHYHSLLKDLAFLLDNIKPENLKPAQELIFNLQFFQKLLKDIKTQVDNITSVES